MGMTQNNREHANTNIPELTQTPEAQRQTTLAASIFKQDPILGAVIDYYGRCLGVIAWFVSATTGDMFANIDNGTIVTNPNGQGEATVRIQDRDTGLIRIYGFQDVVTAFSALGLRTEYCNGINGWLEMSSLLGSASTD